MIFMGTDGQTLAGGRRICIGRQKRGKSFVVRIFSRAATVRWETEASDNWSEGGVDLNCKGEKKRTRRRGIEKEKKIIEIPAGGQKVQTYLDFIPKTLIFIEHNLYFFRKYYSNVVEMGLLCI